MMLVVKEEGVEGKCDSATGVTSFCTPCSAKASKGTRMSGADAVLKMSPGSRSRYSVRGIICRPRLFDDKVSGNYIHHVVPDERGGSVKAYQIHQN